MSAPGRVANKAAEEGGLPVAHMARYEDGREVLFKHCEVAEGIAKSNAGVHIPLYDRASRQDEATSILRDMLAIQTACDLHTDEYAPGSVIEYIKELEAEIASRQVASQSQASGACSPEQYLKNVSADVVLALRNTGRNALAELLEGAVRQVANKAEAEPIGYMRFRAAQSYDGRGDIDHNEWFEQCAPDELGDDKLPAFPVYATPPATTGASTARDAILEEAAMACEARGEEIVSKWTAVAGNQENSRSIVDDAKARAWDALQCAMAIRALKGSVGASTVLTDERISAGARWLSNHQADACGVDREDNWKVYGNQIIEEFREACEVAFGTPVAAQAGQVAVPEGFALVHEDATNEMIAAIEREVESQLDASGIARSDMCRLDGEHIFDALFDAMLAEAPTSAAVAQQAPDQLEQLIIEKRIAITPENEGGFHAAIYGDDEHPQEVGYGQTPMEAIKAARPAQQAPAQAAPAPVCSVDGAKTLPLCVGTCAKSGTCIERAATGRPLIGKLLDQFSELPVLWGLNEPGALVRHGDVFKMLVAAGKSMQASTSGERSQDGGAA